MEWLLWGIIVLFFIGSLVGIVVPVIPDALLVWGGFLIYQFFVSDQGLPPWFWWAMGGVTVLIILADVLTNMVFVKKYGGSKAGMIASVIGLLIGPFILGPIGVLVGPILLVFAVEWFRNKDAGISMKIALGTLAAFFSSAGAKLVLQLIMITTFFIAI
ncbi:DUF456 domain-containing protein [Ammoniphilus sp. CFH 90114]|uniref:DUF456 domain-containing protein n=1 Tax=Ammoniphilus sp. CFH 90114 TaxID=2493665 RepID=UPI00100FBA16|nr:DUF456 family protein [Ammoniphilus sp. CFH 90114]RXT04102.1 DUF456 family protein [Ammoniphilus sp. CFH 90114]